MDSDFAKRAKSKRSESQRAADRKYEDKRKGWRARAWTCVVYLDSAPENWKDLLHDLGISYDISPLHNLDVNAEGELKKEHYHVVLDWGSGSLASGDQAREAFDAFGGVYPDPAKSKQEFLKACKVRKLQSALRYLCHLDEHDPSKHHYNVDDVVSGFQDLPYTSRIMTDGEVDEQALIMADYCEEHDILDFATFVTHAKMDHPEWMHEVIHGKAGSFVWRVISGRQSRNREERERKKYLMNKWKYEKETGLPTPEQVFQAVEDRKRQNGTS